MPPGVLIILSDVTLRKKLDCGELVAEPLEDYLIQPASIDLRLGSQFLQVDENAIEIIRLDDPIKYVEIGVDEIIIPPFSFLLATTMEYIKLPQDLTASKEGRSSIGRIGLFVENAAWVDPGFEGELTLE